MADYTVAPEPEGGLDRPPVVEPEASPADELIEELAPRMDEDDERTLAHRVVYDYHSALQDRLEWETRLAEWEDAYYGRVGMKDQPWPGCSNFHVPVTMTYIESFKPRLVESILGQTPPLIVVPINAAEEERKDRTETFLNWQILTELALEPVVTQSAHLFLAPGTVVAKTTWNVRRTRRKMVREFPLKTDLEHVLAALFGEHRPHDLEKVGEMEWEGTIPASPQGGEDLAVRLRMKVLASDEDPEGGTLQVLLEKDEVIERPLPELVEPIDFIAPARGGHTTNEMPWCQQRLWLTEDELRRKVELKRFYADAVQDLLDQHTRPSGDLSVTDSMGYRRSQSAAEGVEDLGPSNVRRDQFLVLEDYRRWDVDGDGYEEEILCWVCPQLDGRLLGWDYLDNVYAHGRRPFRVGRFFPVPFRFYGLALAEVVRGIQEEINTIHNMKVDFGTIANLPAGFYRSSMSAPPIQQPMKPGSWLPVDNPQQDVREVKYNTNPTFGQQEEQILLQYGERLIGIQDLTLGRQPNRVGATRTAAGTQTLLGEAGLRFKLAMQAFQRFWLGIFEDILALDQEYLPPGKEFRVTGKRPEFVRMKDRTEIRGRYDLRLAATAESLNRQQMRNDASLIMQSILNPALIQAGIVGMKGVKRAVEDFLKAYGKDPDFFLEPKTPVRSPEEEFAMFVAGSYVSPAAGEDIQRHLQTHQLQMQDPDLAAFLRPEVRERLQRHMQETQQLQQAQQMAQMMQQGQGRQGGPPGAMQAGNKEQGQAAPQPAQAAPGASGPQATNLGAQGMGR